MPGLKAIRLALLAVFGVAGAAVAQTPSASSRELAPPVRSRRPAARPTEAVEATRLGGQAPARSATSRTGRADGVMTPEERHDLRHTAHPSRRAVNRHRQDGRARD